MKIIKKMITKKQKQLLQHMLGADERYTKKGAMAIGVKLKQGKNMWKYWKPKLIKSFVLLLAVLGTRINHVAWRLGSIARTRQEKWKRIMMDKENDVITNKSVSHLVSMLETFRPDALVRTSRKPPYWSWDISKKPLGVSESHKLKAKRRKRKQRARKNRRGY